MRSPPLVRRSRYWLVVRPFPPSRQFVGGACQTLSEVEEYAPQRRVSLKDRHQDGSVAAANIHNRPDLGEVVDGGERSCNAARELDHGGVEVRRELGILADSLEMALAVHVLIS